jgi:regulator of RNase E activity RraA
VVPSDRKGEPQDVYHNAIDNAPKGGIMVVDASCADGACTGELMSRVEDVRSGRHGCERHGS